MHHLAINFPHLADLFNHHFAVSSFVDDHHPKDSDLSILPKAKLHLDLLNNNNSQYYVDFHLGKPQQHFTGIFDTGSATTWVPGVKCNSETCTAHNRFAEEKSASFAADGPNTRSVQYGTGRVTFEDGSDTVTLCDGRDNPGCHGQADHKIEIPKQPIGISTDQTKYPFRILPFDGIIGVAPSVNENSLLHQLKHDTAESRLFGVYLSKSPDRIGSVDFGGIERMNVAPDSSLHWHPTTVAHEWRVPMKDILVNGQPLHLCKDRPDGICPAVVDTGSSLVTGPSTDVRKLLSKLHPNPDCSNLASLPEVSIQIMDKDHNTVTYPLNPKEYVLESLEESGSSVKQDSMEGFPVLGKSTNLPEIRPHCDPGFGILDVPGQKWVIGDTFLRRYYSIFDDENGRIGFVRSIHPDETPAAAPTPPQTPDRIVHEAAFIDPAAFFTLLVAKTRMNSVVRDPRSRGTRFL